MKTHLGNLLTVTLVFIVLLAVILGCSTKPETNVPTAAPTPQPTQPYLGMREFEFQGMCKGWKPGFNNESTSGKIRQYVVSYSKENLAKGCVGYFTFLDGNLDSIGN